MVAEASIVMDSVYVVVQLLLKLSVVLVLCEAYTKLRRLGLEQSDPVLLQVNFHSFFVLSILGEYAVGTGHKRTLLRIPTLTWFTDVILAVASTTRIQCLASVLIRDTL